MLPSILYQVQDSPTKEDEVPTSSRMANKAKEALQHIPAVLNLLKLEGTHCMACDQQVPAVPAAGLGGFSLLV